MIWQAADPTGNFYFTDGLNGPRITAYTNEMNEINNLAPISDVRPPLKKVETLSQREVRNINQNAQNIAQNIHANAKESLQSIENIFGLKKGANSDGSVLMYREKGEPGLIKKYYRRYCVWSRETKYVPCRGAGLASNFITV